jgi:chromosome segregation ATPase
VSGNGSRATRQVDKDIQKALKLMEEVEGAVAQKKEVSRQVKALRTEVLANERTANELQATQQHLKRQRANLIEKLQRLEHQVRGCIAETDRTRLLYI